MHCARFVLAVGALIVGSVRALTIPSVDASRPTFPPMRVPQRDLPDSEESWYLGSHPLRGIRSYDNDACRNDEHGDSFIRLHPLANFGRCLPINNKTSIHSSDSAYLQFFVDHDCSDASRLIGQYYIAPDECAKVELDGKHFQSVKIFPICVYGVQETWGGRVNETWCAQWPVKQHWTFLDAPTLSVRKNSQGLRKYEFKDQPGEDTWVIM